jgi:ABC-type sugar transport system permease subunit
MMIDTSLVAPPPAMSRVSRHWSRYRAGYLFVLPAFLLYAVFMIYPFVQSIYFTFIEWNGADPVKTWVGLDNYRELVRDDLFWKALRHNATWVVIGTVSPMVIGMLLAMLLWTRPKGFTLFRTVFFMPQVLSSVVIALVWSWVYNPIFGLLNKSLDAVGLESVSRGWLGDPDFALYAVLGAAIWAEIGFVFVVFLAGLQNVSRDLLEAATLDGANIWQRFRNVTIPQMANVINVVTALLLIGGFAVFDIVVAMTPDGGVNNSTEVIATYAYSQAFTLNRVGYASTLSLVMTVITLVASVLFILLRERNDA